MVRLFGEIHSNSKFAWDEWAKEFNEWLPDDTGPPQSLASLKRKRYRIVSAQPPTGAPTIDPLIEQAYILNQDVEAHQPGTNVTATIMGDNDNIIDEDLDKAEANSNCNNQQPATNKWCY